ncbi:MAG: TonB-dependent receptor [Bacteroidetes bacterium]|nr:TonB-dependent receptor [Bacteroidota bacterium]
MKSLILSMIMFSLTLQAIAQQKPAQETSVHGRIVQENNGDALPGANILLLRMPDSTSAGGQVAGRDGGFRFENVRNGRYVLRISFIGYHTVQRDIRVRGEDVSVGTITLREQSIPLETVEVQGQAPIAVIKEDTTEFIASAFKVNPDASAEDLVRKMPGITVKDGEVEAQGEKVQQTLVDGRPFFGNDARAVLRNIPAEIISRIQVFDQQSEQARFTGFNDGNEIKTINIVTREALRNARFGKVYGGYGEDDHYRAGAVLNAFHGDQRWSLLAMTNNVNEQNFASEDLLGVMLSSSSNRQPGRGMSRAMSGGALPTGRPNFSSGDMSNFLVNTNNGIATTHAVGLNYIDTWANKVEVSGSYFFNLSDTDARSGLTREYILPDILGQFYDESTDAASQNMNHRLNLRLDYKIDTLNSVLWRPRLSIQQNEGNEMTAASTALESAMINSGSSDFASDLNGLSFENQLLWRKRFETRGRTFSLEVENSYNRNAGDNRLYSEYAAFGMQPFTDTTSQRSDLLRNGWGVETSLMYTEPLGDNGQLMLRHRASYNDDKSDKKTWELPLLAGMAEELDPLLSNEFTTGYLTQNASVGYRYEQDDINAMVGAGYQWAALENEQIYPSPASLHRRFGDIMPYAMLRLKFEQGRDMRLFYRTRTSPPSVDKLQNVLDNSNPLQLSIGNPELQPDYMHFLGMRYSATNPSTGSYFFLFAMASHTMDVVGNSTVLAAADTTVFGGIPLLRGTQITRPENFDGSTSLRSYLTYGLPVSFLKSNLNLNLSATWSRTPSEINGQQNWASTPMTGAGLVVNSNISEEVDFTVSTQSNLTWISNSLRSDADTRYFTQSSRLRFNWIFLDGFVFNTDLAHEYYSGLAEGYNNDVLLWNVSLAYKFLPNDLAELRLTLYDVLKQNNSITRSVTDTYIEDTRTNLLQRFVLLTFTWNIRHLTI